MRCGAKRTQLYLGVGYRGSRESPAQLGISVDRISEFLLHVLQRDAVLP